MPPQKRIKISNERKDFTFYIPNDVLDYIFTFLPIKEAIQASTVATRFKTSWLMNRKFVFDRDLAKSHTRDEFIDIINHAFSSHKGLQIQSFHLYFDPSGVELKVLKWLENVVEKGVEELDLNFIEGYQPFMFAFDFLGNASIKYLKLTYCMIKLPLNLKGFRFLNTLILRKVNLGTRMVDKLFDECIFLETFDIMHCKRMRHFKVVAKNLKVLRVAHCSDIDRITMEAPKLRTFYYIGNLHYFNFGENMRLDDVIFNFPPARGFAHYNQVEAFVDDLKYVKVFTTTSTFLEGLVERFYGGIFGDIEYSFGNLRELQLLFENGTFCNIYDIAILLRNCPRLERLFTDIDDCSVECGLYWEYHQKQRLYRDYNHYFTHLKMIQIKGFNFQKHDIEIVKFFLQKSVCLEHLYLTFPRNGHADIVLSDVLLYQQLFMSWKASPEAKITVYEHQNDNSPDPVHNKLWD